MKSLSTGELRIEYDKARLAVADQMLQGAALDYTMFREVSRILHDFAQGHLRVGEEETDDE